MTENAEKNKVQPKIGKGSVGQVERYLTEMKELPTKGEMEEVKIQEKKAQKEGVKTVVDKPISESKPQSSVEPPEIQRQDEKDNKENKETIYSVKDIILLVINIVSIILLFVILLKLPEKAAELKSLRIENIRNESNISIEFPDIASSKEKTDEIERLFIDDSGIVDFVKEVEEIKAAGGAVDKLNFTSQKAVKDRSENFGIPVVIELKGSWQQINTDLKRIQATPYLFRAVKIEIEEVSEEEENYVIFKYGGFLYVIDKLGEG